MLPPKGGVPDASGTPASAGSSHPRLIGYGTLFNSACKLLSCLFLGVHSWFQYGIIAMSIISCVLLHFGTRPYAVWLSLPLGAGQSAETRPSQDASSFLNSPDHGTIIA
jgi:hypothetical protein